MLMSALTKGIHQLLSQTKVSKEEFDKATLVAIVRGLTDLVDQLPTLTQNGMAIADTSHIPMASLHHSQGCCKLRVNDQEVDR